MKNYPGGNPGNVLGSGTGVKPGKKSNKGVYGAVGGRYPAPSPEPTRGAAQHFDNQRAKELLKPIYPDKGTAPGPRGQP